MFIFFFIISITHEFSRNFTIENKAAADCPELFESYSKSMDKLKSMIDIKPKVVQDFAAIVEEFPCNQLTQEGLHRFVNIFFLQLIKIL